MTLNLDRIKINKSSHVTVFYRRLRSFNLDLFLKDPSFFQLNNIYSFNDPDLALDYWVRCFTQIVNRYAPLCEKRVGPRRDNPWFSSKIQCEINKRDWLLRNGNFIEYKKQRNYVKLLIRRQKKLYFEELIKKNRSSKAIWSAINKITSRKCYNPVASKTLGADTFASNFAKYYQCLVQ